jgi:mono/diheme cytochrome c family protein
MKISFRTAVLGIAALALGLPGCGLDRHPAYSSGIKYGLRHDPILRPAAAKDLGDERYEPDRPGVFPIMKLDDAFKFDHPYYAKTKVFLAGALKEVIDKTNAGLSDEQRRPFEDKLLHHPAGHRDAFAEKLDRLLRDPSRISDQGRKDLEAELEAMFGTPAKPIVNAKAAEIDEAAITDLKLDEKTLAMGSTRYRIHCLHCHGVPGDGRGPTARWINPHPRDFRAGLFKFQSVDQTGSSKPPARADLMRTLRQGIEGTAMPTFNLLSDADLEAIISYVIHLSIRGKVEATAIIECFEYGEKNHTLERKKGEDGDIKANVKAFTLQFVMGRDGKGKTDGWLASNNSSSAIKPRDIPYDPSDMTALAESVKRGQQIFTANPSPELQKDFFDRIFQNAIAEAKSAAVSKAMADAETKAIEDAENMAIKAAQDKQKTKLTEEEEYKIKESLEKDHAKIKAAVQQDRAKVEAAAGKDLKTEEIKKATEAKVLSTLKGANCVSCHTDYGRQARFRFDDWGTLVRPNNLSIGQLRGGKRPVDIYYRIHSGINGSGMTPFGKTFEGQEQYIWDLVNFVSVIPYPAMRASLKLDLAPIPASAK